MRDELIDMHCHLDFLHDPAGFAQDAASRRMGFFCNTVTPDGFLTARAALAGCDNVRVGLGLHPWWVHDGRCGPRHLERMCDLMGETRFVGEVGLDFGKRCAASRERQLLAFRRIARACAVQGGKVMSIHAVQAADAVLDVLEETNCLTGNQVVFHWFSHSNPALWRAIHAGCFFSVNVHMLASGRGREYAKLFPVDRLLLETDLPPQDNPGYSLDSWEAELRAALDRLELIRGVQLAQTLAANSRLLLA